MTNGKAKQDSDIHAPPARRTKPQTDKTDHLEDEAELAEDRQEALIDEAVEESFPASDPPSPKQIT